MHAYIVYAYTLYTYLLYVYLLWGEAGERSGMGQKVMYAFRYYI